MFKETTEELKLRLETRKVSAEISLALAFVYKLRVCLVTKQYSKEFVALVELLDEQITQKH